MPDSLRDRYRRLAGLSPTIPKLLSLSIWLGLCFELVKILPPYLFKLIIDRLVSVQTAPTTLIPVLLGGYLGSLLAMSVVEALATLILGSRNIAAEVDVLTRAFAKLLKLDLGYHERTSSGSSVAKLLKGASRLNELLFSIHEHLIPIGAQAFLTLLVFLLLAWQAALFYALMVPLFVALLLRGTRRTQRLREEYHRHQEAFGAGLGQALVNIRTVKDFTNERRELEAGRAHLDRYYETVRQRLRIGVRTMMLEDSLVSLARIGMLAIAVWLMLDGRITAGSLVFITTLSEKAFINLQRLGRAYFRMEDAEPGVARFAQILAEPAGIVDSPESPLTVLHGEIRFDGVSFRYAGARAHALHATSFTVAAKGVTAIVGRSGAGKSTVIKLLLRHADATAGRVLVDGHDVRAYALARLRQGIGIVAQEVELFDDTVLANLRYGAPAASRAEAVRAAKRAHAHEFITKLQRGYDTVIGERGVRLSGGQKQRLAIARALLRKPRILIFDEATSSLDAESERLIHGAIRHLRGTLTLVIIAHRFSTIERAEQIILLEQGRVAERGTHAQLIRKRGIFYKLRELQRLGDLE